MKSTMRKSRFRICRLGAKRRSFHIYTTWVFSRSLCAGLLPVPLNAITCQPRRSRRSSRWLVSSRAPTIRTTFILLLLRRRGPLLFQLATNKTFVARRHNESKFIRSFGKYQVEIYSAVLCVFFKLSSLLSFFCIFGSFYGLCLPCIFRKEQTVVKATEAETVAAAVAYYAI